MGRARRDGARGGRHGAARASASALILAVLGLQGLAVARILCPPRAWVGLSGLRVGCAPLLFPFLDYPMFNEAHRAGDTIEAYAVIVELEDGAELRLRPEEQGARPAATRLVAALLERDREGVRRFCDDYQRLHAARVVACRLEKRKWVLTRRGFEPKPSELSAPVRVEADSGEPR